ncbi:MAG: diphthine--ammonia ligase [Methanobacteriota archaeon]|nr:MAG: diphthine--ammonia ligase [Euryarchaeota archaeon]
MKVAALFSGGKDSTYAIYAAQQRGWDVTHLITIRPEDAASMLYHVPNVHVTPLLAEALGIPLITQEAGRGEEAELDALRAALRRVRVDGVIVGTIASDYQHRRVNRVGHELGLRVFAPLWRRNPEHLLVSAEGLDASWLGRALDASAVTDLLGLRDRVGVHPCGEGGEYETIVLHAPNFQKRLEVVKAVREWEGSAGRWRIEEATLA